MARLQMVELSRRNLMHASVAAAVGAGVAGTASAQNVEDPNTSSAPLVDGEIKRFATTAYGAEVTGPFVFDQEDGVPPGAFGTLIFSLQHPTDPEEVDRQPEVVNEEGFRDGAIGYVSGFQFDSDGSSDEFAELGIPKTKDEQGKIRTAAGDYTIIAREQEEIGWALEGPSEKLGVPQTSDGTNVDTFAGSRYSRFGNDPDMNQFVPDPETETSDGFIYTNFEQSPGTLSRVPATITAQGEVDPDLPEATNLANYDALRELGGTRINCYGDLSPWGTPLSAEEEYSHTRVSLTSTVSDMVESGGVGRRGAAQFYNRPNPTGIQGSVGEYYDSGWYVQGYFALAGLEIQAKYLGAEKMEDDGTDLTDLTPIVTAEGADQMAGATGYYPNPYRYGYIVDFRNPAAEDPADIAPVKYYVMGRGAWEAPDVQNDQRTVYLCSDGSNKGIYKFRADRPIPSYDDTDDISGTLYAPKVTNEAAAQQRPPGSVDLEIEWLPLGSATNREVEDWIAEYDGIDQVDYLETHAGTDWREDLQTALEEADREVVANGNQNYITDQAILDWAEQYRTRGPDGVDEELRKIPFLETRAAAKEIGATIEFRKAEGIDSADDATPGDYVYVGLSEVNDGLADEEGDLRFRQVDGGMVYRAELEPDYNISTLEPVIVGPDASDPASVSDDALLNIDNVYVLRDGRVLCCEDADQLGRSYPNDGMYVFTPEEAGPGRSRKAPNGRGDGNGRGPSA